MSPGYEAFFGFDERPFSLTPDPKYFFESRSHGSALQTVTDALARRERVVLLTGDLGIGKTILARTLIAKLRITTSVAFIANPLLTPSGLFRLLLEDFGATAEDDIADASGGASPELRDVVVGFLARVSAQGARVVIVVDEAQTTPASVVEQLQSLGAIEERQGLLLQLVLVGQPLLGETGAQGMRVLSDRISTRTRLMPLTRDECASYVAHRLRIAGAAPTLSFSTAAIDLLYGLSGGVPRLTNLLAERALQEAALQRTHKVGPAMVDSAASALELLRGTPRRFRWFSRRVS